MDGGRQKSIYFSLRYPTSVLFVSFFLFFNLFHSSPRPSVSFFSDRSVSAEKLLSVAPYTHVHTHTRGYPHDLTIDRVVRFHIGYIYVMENFCSKLYGGIFFFFFVYTRRFLKFFVCAKVPAIDMIFIRVHVREHKTAPNHLPPRRETVNHESYHC